MDFSNIKCIEFPGRLSGKLKKLDLNGFRYTVTQSFKHMDDWFTRIYFELDQYYFKTYLRGVYNPDDLLHRFYDELGVWGEFVDVGSEYHGEIKVGCIIKYCGFSKKDHLYLVVAVNGDKLSYLNLRDNDDEVYCLYTDFTHEMELTPIQYNKHGIHWYSGIDDLNTLNLLGSISRFVDVSNAMGSARIDLRINDYLEDMDEYQEHIDWLYDRIEST